MNSADLCASLNITKAKLDGFIRQGLPCSGTGAKRTFEEPAVIAWLLANDLAEPTQVIFDTTREVADHFGEPHENVRKWFSRSNCPGKPGCYVLADIEDWVENDKLGKGKYPRQKKDDPESDRLSISDELKLIKLESARGQVISLEEVKSEFVRQQTMIRSELSTINAKIESRLPGEISQDLRAMIRDVVTETVETCYATFREILERDSQ